jgi:hypothetical protein
VIVVVVREVLLWWPFFTEAFFCEASVIIDMAAPHPAFRADAVAS